VTYGASRGEAPDHAYWTSDYLYYDAAQNGGRRRLPQGQPSLVCPPSPGPDNEGNSCSATGCAYDDFGGCLQCWVSLGTGNSCPTDQPMHVCAPNSTDGYGNFCAWTNCGDDQTGATDEYFGGCTGVGADTAGTLCCCNQ
jgi:hypothetical protein